MKPSWHTIEGNLNLFISSHPLLLLNFLLMWRVGLCYVFFLIWLTYVVFISTGNTSLYLLSTSSNDYAWLSLPPGRKWRVGAVIPHTADGQLPFISDCNIQNNLPGFKVIITVQGEKQGEGSGGCHLFLYQTANHYDFCKVHQG